MQRSILMGAPVAAIGLGAALSAPHARAQTNHPYCATPTWSEGLDCDFRTFQECVASVAGFNRACVANLSFSGAQAQFPQTQRKPVH